MALLYKISLSHIFTLSTSSDVSTDDQVFGSLIPLFQYYAAISVFLTNDGKCLLHGKEIK